MSTHILVVWVAHYFQDLNFHSISLFEQIVHLGSVVQPAPGDRFLSLLPPWHMYERSAEYFALSRGVSQVYASVKSLKVCSLTLTPFLFLNAHASVSINKTTNS